MGTPGHIPYIDSGGDQAWGTPGTAGITSGVSDHGALAGTADDDHTQYALADGSRGAFEASGAVATHSADTTSVHGITDTANLVLTSDSRLTDSRTPTTHASSHAVGGSDPITGLVKAARVSGSDATTTSNTIGSITGLSFSIGANEVWAVDVFLSGQCSSTGGTKWGVNGPSGATIEGFVHGNAASATAFRSDRITALNTLTGTANWTVATTALMARLTFTIAASSTSGTCQIQFASGTNTQTSTVRIGSHLRATRLA